MLASVAPYVSAFYFGKIGGTVLETGDVISTVIYFAIIWSVFTLVETMSYTIRGIVETWLDINLYPKLQIIYLESLNNIDIGKTETEEYISTFQKLTNGQYPPWVVLSFTRKLTRFLSAELLTIVISLVIVTKVGILYTGLLVALLIPRFIAELFYGSKAFDIWSKKEDAADRTSFWLLHDYFNKRDVKPEIILHKYSGFFADKLKASAQRMFLRKKAMLGQKTAVELFADVLYQVGVCILIIAIARQTIAGVYAFSFFTLVFYSLNQISSSISKLLETVSAFVNDGRVMQEVIKMYEMKPLISVLPNEKTNEILSENTLMKFIDVSFSYAGSKIQQSKNLNFEILKGERLAIIGLNGAGKSTLIKLITRIYDPVSGSILVRNKNKTVPLVTIHPEKWQEDIVCMFQDYGRYEFTVKEYITLGLPVNDRKLKAVIEMATADFIFESVKGLEQQLGIDLDGVNLSKGEWQKLALARTLYRNSPLIILDEPTATIDALSSRKIYENLKLLNADQTLIFISHNMIDIPIIATRIMMLQDGEIVALGTHKELLKSSLAYKELYTSAKG